MSHIIITHRPKLLLPVGPCKHQTLLPTSQNPTDKGHTRGGSWPGQVCCTSSGTRWRRSHAPGPLEERPTQQPRWLDGASVGWGSGVVVGRRRDVRIGRGAGEEGVNGPQGL